ncbi:hypothetical protein LEP1GSC170_2929 [Leptospira interrogans serovar Bataviae str. HAI135]|nr:hypothetical protein LEP1GSC170_2929 [Leptospira interrogans serovar Bataviae str. HAI135]
MFLVFSISCFAGIRKELNYSSDTIAFYSFENGPDLPIWLDRNAIYINNKKQDHFKTAILEALNQMGNRNDSLINDSAFRIFSKELSQEIAERSYQNFERFPNQTYQLWILKRKTISIRVGEFEGLYFYSILQ